MSEFYVKMSNLLLCSISFSFPLPEGFSFTIFWRNCCIWIWKRSQENLKQTWCDSLMTEINVHPINTSFLRGAFRMRYNNYLRSLHLPSHTAAVCPEGSYKTSGGHWHVLLTYNIVKQPHIFMYAQCNLTFCPWKLWEVFSVLSSAPPESILVPGKRNPPMKSVQIRRHTCTCKITTHDCSRLNVHTQNDGTYINKKF